MFASRLLKFVTVQIVVLSLLVIVGPSAFGGIFRKNKYRTASAPCDHPSFGVHGTRWRAWPDGEACYTAPDSRGSIPSPAKSELVPTAGEQNPSMKDVERTSHQIGADAAHGSSHRQDPNILPLILKPEPQPHQAVNRP